MFLAINIELLEYYGNVIKISYCSKNVLNGKNILENFVLFLVDLIMYFVCEKIVSDNLSYFNNIVDRHAFVLQLDCPEYPWKKGLSDFHCFEENRLFSDRHFSSSCSYRYQLLSPTHEK